MKNLSNTLTIGRVVSLSLLAFALWLVGLMPFMSEAQMHYRRLFALVLLGVTTIAFVWMLRRYRHLDYVVAVIASTAATLAYFLLYPILFDAEFVFVLTIIGISAQWGLKAGLVNASLSTLAYGLFHNVFSSGHSEVVVETLAIGGFFVISALIVGTLSHQREAALLTHIRLAEKLQDSYDATLDALAAALDARDRETQGHSQRVTALTLTIAREMKVSHEQLQQIRWGALLHDVGKIGIPDHILRKPGELNDEEWVLMRRHPQIGYDILKGISFLQPALSIVLHHHERFDGKGYPQGLKGESIPLSARIFAVADTFDAMTNDRLYRRACPQAEAVTEIRNLAGQQFDPAVVQAFERVLRHDPT